MTELPPHHRRFVEQLTARFATDPSVEALPGWSWQHGRPPLDES